MRKLKALHFYKTAFPESVGGVEKVIDQLARSSSSYGFESTILALSDNPSLAPSNINGYNLYWEKCHLNIASTSFSMSVFSTFSKLAKEADIIHYHFPWPFMDMVHFTTQLRKPTIVTYHSDIIKQKILLKFYKPLMHRFLSSVDHIVATSPNYFASSDILHKYSDKISIIPIGLDRITYPNPTQERIKYWQEKFPEKFFLFIGVFRYYKGLHILLEASRGENFPIIIIGSGQMESELKEAAKRLNLTNLHFLGQLSDEDKVALLQLSYAVVFPSHLRSEAFGISLLEGAMFGKPMISCEIGTGTTYINADGKTGIVIPPGNPAALREAMKHLLEHPEKAAEMGKQAEARYLQFFTGEAHTEAYAKLYQKLINASKDKSS